MPKKTTYSKCWIAFCILFAVLLSGGCAMFSTPQERSGVNPKPFNYQTNWEIQPNQGRIFY